MKEPRRLRESRDALTAEEIAILDAMECPPPPPGAKERVALGVLEALAEDAPEVPPATVRRIG